MGENLGAATEAKDRRISSIEKCGGPSGLDPGTGTAREGEVPGPGSARREVTLDQATASTPPQSPPWSAGVLL